MSDIWYDSRIRMFIEKHESINMPDETKILLLNYFEAMAHFYGIIALQRVYKILTEVYHETIAEQEFYELTCALHENAIGHYFINADEEVFGWDNISVPEDRLLIHESAVAVDLDIYENIKKLKKEKPFYIPEKNELLKYLDDFYYEETEYVKELRRFFIRKIDAGRGSEIADQIVSLATMENYEFEDTLNDIERMGEELSIDEIEEFVPYYISLRNNTRMPANNGYTPAEIEELFKDSEKTVDSLFVSSIEINEEKEATRRKENADKLRKMKAMAELMRKSLEAKGVSLPKIPEKKPKKIGRNDPCPCGSGKKFKKCCGR